jgi:hypothetical protein
MPFQATKSGPVAGIEIASPSPGDTDRDCLHGDPGSVARATRAADAEQRGVRRRLVDPTTCERDYAASELEFMQAMQEYKRWSGRMFPTWSEVLGVVQGLGYEKATVGRAAPGARPAPSREVTP